MARKTKFKNEIFLVKSYESHSTGTKGLFHYLLVNTKTGCTGGNSLYTSDFLSTYKSNVGSSSYWGSGLKTRDLPARFLQGR